MPIGLLRARLLLQNVFVGRQQYDRYIDHPICDKSLFIYNMVPDVVGEKKRDNDGKTVVLFGSIDSRKGIFDISQNVEVHFEKGSNGTITGDRRWKSLF